MAGHARLDAAVERRASKRFAIKQEITFRSVDAGPPQTGSGHTVDFSSRGVLFRTDQPPGTARRVEISVNWPALLSGTCALKFVAQGHIVRVADELVAVSIERYEFRTRRRSELCTAPS